MKINHINHAMSTVIGKDAMTTDENKRTFVHTDKNMQTEMKIDREKVASTVEKINEFNDPQRTKLKFVLHEDLHEYYVTVVNPQTDEVIREIPPKKMLDMFASMMEYMGILVDEKI